MINFLSDPDYLIALGVGLTLIGGVASGVGTFFNSKNQTKQQKEMTRRADEQSVSQRLLREKSDEIAGLNRQIAESQAILREKAETQFEMQTRLTDKSEEIALLNSHIAHMQKTMRDKSDSQSDLQNTMKEMLEENALTSSNIINFHKENRSAIGEINNKLNNIETALNDYGIKVPKNQSGTFYIDGITVRPKFGQIKLSVNDNHIKVTNGQTLNYDDLTIFAKIKTVNGKKYLHARFVTTDESSKVIDTNVIGYKASCGKYTLTVHEIEQDSATFIIHITE